MDTLQEIIYIEFSCENLTRLTYYCNFSNGQLYDSSLLSLPLTQLGAPATFFICLLHVLVSLLLAVIVFICFNSVRVLGKKAYTSSTSGLWWILYLLMHACYYTAFLLMLPNYRDAISLHTQELIAYYLLNPLHVLTYFFLCGALDHEWRFRTTATATLTVHPYSLRSKLKNTFRYFVNCSRVLFFFQSIILISISSIMGIKREHSILPILLLIYIVALILMQCTVSAIGLAVICKTNRHAKPKYMAKSLLILALFLHTTELFPIFFINGFAVYSHVCDMRIFTPFDILRVLSLIPLILYFLFVGIEYKRVEPMNKYNIVADLQALLQFQR